MSIERVPARHGTDTEPGIPTVDRRHAAAPRAGERTGWRRPFVREWILMVLVGAVALVAFA